MAASPSTSRAALIYTLARIAVFVAVLGVLAVAGLRGYVLVLAAILLSGIVSYFVLSSQRAAFARGLGEQAERRRAARRPPPPDGEPPDGQAR